MSTVSPALTRSEAKSRVTNKMNVLIIIVIALLCSCSDDRSSDRPALNEMNVKEKPVTSRQYTIIEDEKFFGWDSLTLRNMFVRLDVVPDLGGKIMGYDLQGYQVLWHDPEQEGIIDTDQGYGMGERWVNPGGAKVWPAPQGSREGEWPGPPDNVLDAGPYEYTFEGNSITVISPEDNGEGRSGIQLKHVYSLIPKSTLVDLHLTMSNVIDRTVKWSLWHLFTLPVDREFTVYVPVDKGNWHVMYGNEDNPQWLGVEDGLFRARYEKLTGKVGMKASEGWAAWHDEVNNIVFAMMFPIEESAEYPDMGSNIEMWTLESGTPSKNNMELEVLGPLVGLAPGREASLDVKWGVCRCSGVKKVVPAGVIAEELTYENDVIRGKFGVFYAGILQLVYLNDEGEQMGLKNFTDVSPLTEVIIEQESEDILSIAHSIVYRLRSYDEEIIGELDRVNLK
ncbi:DUF4380 domain-containing protein [Candidatus Latescibacterota bacterium]